MGWDALMFGELEFPPGAIGAWRELVIEDGLFDDKAWKQSHWMGDPGETTTVAGLLAKLEDHARWCEKTYKGPDHQRVTIDGDRVSFRAYINEDDFRSWCGLVATMFRVGEKVGATGEYVAIANDDMAGERVVVEGGASRVEPLDCVEIMMGGDGPESALDYQAIIDELMKTTGEKIEKMVASAKPATKKSVSAKPTKKIASAKATKKNAPAQKQKPAKKKAVTAKATKKAAPARKQKPAKKKAARKR